MIKVASIPTEEELIDGYKFWYPQINSPFPFEGGLAIGLSSGWLREAEIAGVSKIKYEWNGKTYSWFVPDKRMKKQMEAEGLYKEKIVNYPQPLKIYYFLLN